MLAEAVAVALPLGSAWKGCLESPVRFRMVVLVLTLLIRLLWPVGPEGVKFDRLVLLQVRIR